MCDTCPKAFHLVCLEPELEEAPEGEWFCAQCEKDGLAATKKAQNTEVLSKSAPAMSDFEGIQHQEQCSWCKDGGELLCCDACPQTYHLECLNPPLRQVPNGEWYCPKCSAEKPKGHCKKILTWRWKVVEEKKKSDHNNDDNGDEDDESEVVSKKKSKPKRTLKIILKKPSKKSKRAKDSDDEDDDDEDKNDDDDEEQSKSQAEDDDEDEDEEEEEDEDEEINEEDEEDDDYEESKPRGRGRKPKPKLSESKSKKGPAKTISTPAKNPKAKREPMKIREFFVKYEGLSYWHCDWVDEIIVDVHHKILWRFYTTRNDMTNPPSSDQLKDGEGDCDDDYNRKFYDPKLEAFYKNGVRPQYLQIHRILNYKKTNKGEFL